MTLTVTITGATEVERAILELARTFPERVASALNIEANLTMAEAKERCPIDWGGLVASGQVQMPEIHGREISNTLGFGNQAVKYALKVHENPRAGKTGGWGPKGPQDKKDWFRWINGRVVPVGAPRKHWAKVGQWKYLEQPFLARAAGFAERIHARVMGMK